MADRISTLPDSLIHHILSFLPTEQAIATSVLSKRWMPLWLAAPALNFDDSRYSRNKESYFHFLHMVSMVMLLRDGEQSIKKFHLRCKSHLCDTSVVKPWVLAATKRKVEHFNLSLHYYVNLPSSVFSSTTLVFLELSGGFSVHNSHSSVSFPSLKILHFRGLRLQERKCVVEILSTCPLLEVLVMKFLSVGELTPALMPELHLPKLVKVDISHSSLIFSLQTFYNVRFLCADVMGKPNLTPHNFSNLTYMELCLFHYHNWNWLVEFLHHCPHLHNLLIDKWYDDSPGSTGDEKCLNLPQIVPQCLLSELRNFRQCNYEGDKCELQFTRFIIQNSRVLRKVTICGIRFSNQEVTRQMINDLSSCPRGSVTCELYFE